MVKQLAELKAINMLTTLVLRQEVQLNIHKQDTAYVLFLNTQGQDSMAGSLFHIGAQWHKTKSQAQAMGYLRPDGKIPGLRWDPQERQHVLDDRVEALPREEIEEALKELMVLSSKDYVISRFHGMRKLTEEFRSPTVGMFLELGMRTEAANRTRQLLHRLCQSGAWLSAGCYLRHERMQLSALAKRLSNLSSGARQE